VRQLAWDQYIEPHSSALDVAEASDRVAAGGLLMNFQGEDSESTRTEQPIARCGKRDPNIFRPHVPNPKPIPPGRARELAPETLPPFSDLVEIDCQDCGGKGYDSGGVNTQEAEDCSSCHGSGKETVLRNYLAEAFRIAADPRTNLQLERAHLVALTAYARQTVSVLLTSLPEVA
jgi:hypothetical protein